MTKKLIYLLALALIWGSSFILIKKALLGFTAVQLGGFRILIASFFLFILGFRSMRTIQKKDWKWLIIAGTLSSCLPPFLFALAQTELDSGVTAIFNSLTPLLTAGVGALLFGAYVSTRQRVGVIVGLLGTSLLMLAGSELHPDQNYGYAFFIFISAMGYAFNINIIKRHLFHLSPLAITTASFGVAVPPTILILMGFDMSRIDWSGQQLHIPLACLFILAILGTGIANILFNMLIKVSSPVYAASVTYLIPLVAVLWGLGDGEIINLLQLLGGIIILFGVFLVNRKSKNPEQEAHNKA